jgi:myo-inositol-1(or 4)-monophosphatase
VGPIRHKDRMLDDLLDMAKTLALKAVNRHQQGSLGAVSKKSTPTDPVTQVDTDSEQLIVDALRSQRPDDGILGEEGTQLLGKSGFVWVIDPLDGTVNYLYGIPSHAVSIAVEYEGKPLVGVVHDSALNDVYSARLGGGAFCNGQPIAVTNETLLSQTLLGTGFSYDSKERLKQSETLVSLVPKVRDIRRSGCCALDLCWTAAGRLDAFYERGPHPWDVQAGVLIVEEAGGQANYDVHSKKIVASGTGIWATLNRAILKAEKKH